MDSSSNQILDDRALKKQLALFLTGSAENYEYYKRTQQIKIHYPNDFDYYNDTFYVRHDRNIQELNKIKTLIKQGILKQEMLLFNTWNAFYPSYIMNHHFTVYLQVLNLLSKEIKNENFKEIFRKAQKMEQIGCYC